MPLPSVRSFMLGGLLAVSIPVASAANSPQVEDYLIGPASLPPMPSDGVLHELKLEPASLSRTIPAGMPVIEFSYAMGPSIGKAVAVQIFDSGAYATMNRMQLAGQLGGSQVRARCYQPVTVHPGNEPRQAIDGFVSKANAECTGEIFLMVPSKGQDRFLVRLVELDAGHIEPEKLHAWLLAGAATLDFRKLQKIPAVE